MALAWDFPQLLDTPWTPFGHTFPAGRVEGNHDQPNVRGWVTRSPTPGAQRCLAQERRNRLRQAGPPVALTLHRTPVRPPGRNSSPPTRHATVVPVANFFTRRTKIRVLPESCSETTDFTQPTAHRLRGSPPHFRGKPPLRTNRKIVTAPTTATAEPATIKTTPDPWLAAFFISE